MGKLKNSFQGGEGNLIGFLGEEMFQRAYSNAVHIDNYSCDFVLNGKTIDVKCNLYKNATEPHDYFETSIAGYKTPSQNIDFFVFTAIYKDFKKGWLLGYIGKNDFWNLCTTRRKGEQRTNGKYYTEDSHIITLDKLKSFDFVNLY